MSQMAVDFSNAIRTDVYLGVFIINAKGILFFILLSCFKQCVLGLSGLLGLNAVIILPFNCNAIIVWSLEMFTVRQAFISKLFFPVLFLFDWVGFLWPQLSKVLKVVCWAGSVDSSTVTMKIGLADVYAELTKQAWKQWEKEFHPMATAKEWDDTSPPAGQESSSLEFRPT